MLVMLEIAVNDESRSFDEARIMRNCDVDSAIELGVVDFRQRQRRWPAHSRPLQPLKTLWSQLRRQYQKIESSLRLTKLA
jgi:hypothetical protein